MSKVILCLSCNRPREVKIKDNKFKCPVCGEFTEWFDSDGVVHSDQLLQFGVEYSEGCS